MATTTTYVGTCGRRGPTKPGFKIGGEEDDAKEEDERCVVSVQPSGPQRELCGTELNWNGGCHAPDFNYHLGYIGLECLPKVV
mmetsp:Transcript_97145/g.278015  ORF Transcript_97145/g.278015 Transcript_97145/m.278015 type:complete len:83 (-) Transcript_97145:151-399(-)